MAGSSLPVTFRRPELDFPLGTQFEEALQIGKGWLEDGEIFHNFETLQCFLERRKGEETGVRSVEHFEGGAVWEATEQGRWSEEPMWAALERGEKVVPGRPQELVENPVACFLEYNDGFRAACLMLGEYGRRVPGGVPCEG